MADTFTTITTFINSPPGQLAAGGVLGGIVWKFFERVEALLTDRAKFEIAVWLVGVKVGQGVEPFTNIIGQVVLHTWLKPSIRGPVKRLLWVGVISFQAVFISIGLQSILIGHLDLQGFGTEYLVWLFCFCIAATVSNYKALPNVLLLVELYGKCDYLVRRAREDPRFKPDVKQVLSSVYKFAFTALGYSLLQGISALFLSIVLLFIFFRMTYPGDVAFLLFVGLVIKPWRNLYPLFAYWIALVPFICGGLLLKAARRFDIGFDWFNRKFDIEKKPLQSIGLVAGALVALAYWTAALIRHFVT